MKHTAKITLILVGVFLLAQIIGLFVIDNYIDVQKTQETGEISFEDLPLGIERPDIQEDYSFVYILSAVIIGTLLLFVLIRFRLHRVWKVWYALAIFISLTIAFAAFVPATIAAVLGMIIALLKVLRPNVVIHNLGEIFMYGGLAVIFVPRMNIFAAFMLLVLISLYDMYAVWKSKHMIALAKFQSQNQMFAGFYVPYSMPKGKAVRVGSTSVSKMSVPVQIKSAVLGGGDIAFPLLFTGTVFKTVGLYAGIISLTATVALFGLLLYGKKDTFYPAMPFLSIGCFIGNGIIWLL
jgi:presenilin-like A22 family membrane protease